MTQVRRRPTLQGHPSSPIPARHSSSISQWPVVCLRAGRCPLPACLGAAASVLDSHGCRLDPDGIVRDKQSNLRACDLPEDHPPEEVVSLMAEYARTTLAKGAGLLHGPISAARDAPAAWQCNDWSSRGHICVLLPSPAGGYGGLWSRSVAAEHGVVAGSALPYTDLCEAMGWGCLVGDPGAPWEDPDAPRRYAAAVLEHAVAAAPEASLSVLAYGPAAEHVVHALGAQTDLRDRLRAAVFLEARCSALAARNTEVSAWLAAHALGLRSEPDVPFGAVLSDDVARAMAPLLARAAGGGEETESVRQTVPAAWRAIVDAFARAGADVAETPCLELSAGRETGPGGAVPANPNPAHTLHRCCEVALAALFALGSSDGSSDGDGDGDGDGNSSGATECRGPAPEHASNASTSGSGADAGAGPATPRPGASPSALSATLAASRREAGVGTDSVRLRSLLASASHLDDDSWGEGEADWYCAHACASPAVPLCRWQLSVVAYAREALCLPTPHIGETALPGWRWLAHAAQGRGADAEGRALAVPVLPRAGLGWVGGAADETGPLRGPVPAYAAWRDFSHTLPSEEWPIFAHPSLFDLLWEDGVWGGHRGREALAPEPRDPASDPAADGDQPPPLHVAARGGEVAVDELRAAAAAAAEDRSRSASVASSLAGTPVPSRMVTGGDLPPTIGAASVGSEAEDGSSWSLPPYLLRSRLHRASRSNMGAASMPSGASTPAPATDGPGTGPMLLHGAKWTEGGSLRPQAVPLQRYLSAGRMSTFEGQARGRWTQGAEPPPRPRRGKSAGAVDDPALRTAWVPDANAPSCQVCNEGFTVLRRRHHCRACGHVVCARCSEARLPVPGWGSAPVRVCALCEGALAYGRPRGVTVHDFDLLKVRPGLVPPSPPPPTCWEQWTAPQRVGNPPSPGPRPRPVRQGTLSAPEAIGGGAGDEGVAQDAVSEPGGRGATRGGARHTGAELPPLRGVAQVRVPDAVQGLPRNRVPAWRRPVHPHPAGQALLRGKDSPLCCRGAPAPAPPSTAPARAWPGGGG